MGKGVLGVLVGIPTLTAVSIGGTYLGTGETWEAAVLKEGRTNQQKHTDASTWTYPAASVPNEWKEFFECCCKNGTSCNGCAPDAQGQCKASGGTGCAWKVKQSKFEDLKNKCDRDGRKVFWALNKKPDSLSSDFIYYKGVCFKQTGSN